ncbi:MAG: L-rhamnose mutarotase [Bacteroidetes bacterium]|nr:L-rhamnose mutarotase [Bacteroidota bacterium]
MKTEFLQAAKSIILVLLGTAILTFACQQEEKAPERHAFVIGLKPEKMAEYKKLHAEAWPEILELLGKCHIRNYSIHLGEPEKGKYYLFGYFEYVGSDLDKDIAAMAEHEVVQQWWELTDACQIPCPTREEGEFWMELEEVFYMD